MLTGTQDPGLLVLDGANPSVQKSNVVLPDTPTHMIMAPDGGRILIFFPSGVQQYIPATNTISPVATEGNIGTRPVDAVFSEDGTKAYFLSDASKRVTAWNFANGNAEAFLNIGNARFTSIAYSARNGNLYVAAQNFIYEIDPAKFELKSSIAVNGQPDSMYVTSDGNLLVARNTAIYNRNVSLFVVSIGGASRNVTFVPAPANTETLADLSPVSPTRVIARGSDSGTIYDITLSPVGLSNLTATGSVPGSVQSLAVTDQVPNAKYLFAFSQAGLQRLDLSASPNAWGAAAVVPNTTGTISYAAATTTLPPASIQSLTSELRGTPNAILQTVLIRVLDQNGRPTPRVPITWNVNATKLTNVSVDPNTNASGWARATFRAPQTSITGSLTITAGNASPVQIPVTIGENVGGSTNGPGVFIVSGTGIIVPNGNAAPVPLTVFVRGDNGQPAVGAKVTFKVTLGPLFLNLPVVGGNVFGTGCEYDSEYNAICTTDSSGKASVVARGNSITTGDSFRPVTVTATSSGNNATFRMNVIGGTQFVPPDRQLLTPDPAGDTVITVHAGETANGAIKIRFTAGAVGGLQDGRPMPNVGFTVTDPADPATHCDGEAGVALSTVKPYDPNSFGDDPNDGVATCNLIVGPGGTGNHPVVVEIFGQYQLPGYFISLNILPPAAAAITATTGNGASGVTGANVNLQATVTGTNGQALSGQTVTWRVVSGDVTLKNVSTVSDQLGKVNATATLGTKPGAAVIEVAAGNLKAQFTLTIQSAITTLRIADGNNQTAVTGDTFAKPLQVQVIGPDGQGAFGQAVTFSVVSGPVTLVNTSATTNALGLASASVNANATAGTAVVQASVGTLTATFNLTVNARGIQAVPNDFANAFSGVKGTLAPGGIYTLTTKGVAPNVVGTQLTNRFFAPYPTSLNGVTIKVNNLNVIVLSATNANNAESITFQVPWDAIALTAPATVTFNVNNVDTQVTVPTTAVQPAFVTYLLGSTPTPTILDTDNNIVGSNLVAGRRYKALVAGLGQTTPQQFTGKIAAPGQTANNTVTIQVGGTIAVVGTVEAVANQIGLYYVTFDVPAAPVGNGLNLDLKVSVAGVSDSVANPVKVNVTAP